MTTSEIPAAVADGLRLEQPEACPTVIYELIQRMWNSTPTERPTFSAIRQELEKLDMEVCFFRQDGCTDAPFLWFYPSWRDLSL